MKPGQTSLAQICSCYSGHKSSKVIRGIINISKLHSQQHGDVQVMLPNFKMAVTGQRHIFCGTKNLSNII